MYSDYTLQKWLSSQQFWRWVVLWFSFFVFLVCLVCLAFAVAFSFFLWVVLVAFGLVVFVLFYFVVDYFYFQKRIEQMLQHNISHLELWIRFYRDQLSCLEQFQANNLDKRSDAYRFLAEQNRAYFTAQTAQLNYSYKMLLLEARYYQTLLKKIGRF